MARWLIVFILTATALSMIAGCPPKDQGPDEPVAEPGSQQVVEPDEPDVLQPPVVEPNEPIEPNEPVEPDEPVIVEPNEPAHAEPAEPNKPIEPIEPEIPEPNEVVIPEPNTIDVNNVAVVEPNEPVIVEPNMPDANQASESVTPDPNASQDANEAPMVEFHNVAAEILTEYVDKDGFVDYATLARKRLELKAVLAKFDELDRARYDSWPANDKIAFWINAYNLQMMHIIAQNYPIKGSRFYVLMYGPESIRHIKGIWTDYKFMVMREQFNLDEIEKRYFREQFKDPRILFALHQGSVSGPPLLNEPYTGKDLDAQLDAQVKRFLADSDVFEIDKPDGEVRVSPMFQATWYGKDLLDQYGTELKFKAQPAQARAILNFISAFVPKPAASYLEVGNYSLEFTKYDWTVNDISNK